MTRFICSTPWSTRQSVVRLVAIVLASVSALLLAACGAAGGGAGELAEDKQVLASCPIGKHLAAKLDIDGSGSSRTSELDGERAAVVAAVARRTAICSGHLQVTLFATSSTSTAVLYDQTLSLPGATENAKLRRVKKLVDEVVEQVAARYKPAIEKVSPRASDVVGQYRVAAEYLTQLGTGYQLNLVILTDGIQTVGFRLGQPLSRAEAVGLSARVNVPKLPKESSITVAGIGRTSSGTPVSSAVAESLTKFYDALCRRTGAQTCISVTDPTLGR